MKAQLKFGGKIYKWYKSYTWGSTGGAEWAADVARRKGYYARVIHTPDGKAHLYIREK